MVGSRRRTKAVVETPMSPAARARKGKGEAKANARERTA